MTQNNFELTIDAITNGGAGMGMNRKRPVFVPYTIPGERVIVRPVDQSERHTIAEGVKLLDASADRVYPVCPHFGPHRCGRCQWQHMSYEAQLLLKQDILADQLGRVGGIGDRELAAALRPTRPSPEQWAYNYHMTFSVTDDLKLAFPGSDQTFGLQSKALYPIEVCHILHPDLLELYQQLDLELKDIKRVKLQIGSDGERMIILSLTQDDAPELETDLTASINVILPDNEPMNLVGDSHSRYSISGRTLRVTAGSSFRANVTQLPDLISTVESLLDLRDGETLLDLYAGVGVFSAFLAAKASLVTLVESYPPAVTDADENLLDYDNVDVIEGSVEDALAALEETVDAVIVDPPGRGLSKDVIDGLVATQASRLVYVSDDPATLARDTKRLVQQGYRLAAAQPLDSAPQTYYFDTAALFLRR